jgi:hypothetical protein
VAQTVTRPVKALMGTANTKSSSSCRYAVISTNARVIAALENENKPME